MTSPIKVTFITAGEVVHEVDAPEGSTLMQAAVHNSIPGITADCGGACACGTCHVYIDPAWQQAVGPANEIESGMLEFAIDPHENSRLSCQVKITKALNGLVVRVPENQY
jgi:2Fe-2S ferredoxin